MLRNREMSKALAALSLIWVSVIAVMPIPSYGRPEARTPEEFDLYLDFRETLDPGAKHEIALRFERTFPESELLAHVYESEFEYARSRDQRQSAIAVGEKKLRLVPNDIKALLGLAEILPYGTSEPAV